MFLSTQAPFSVYKLIVNSCKFNAEKRVRKKLQVKVIKYKKYPSINYLFYFILFIISGRIFSKQHRLYANFFNIEIGRFITATTFKDARSYTNKFYFYKNYLKNFYKAGVIINSAEYYSKNIKFDFIYIDHCGYMNGILYSFFAKKKFIYTNNYPKNIFLTHKKSFNFYEKNLRVQKDKKKINKSILSKSKRLVDKLINKPGTIPWLAYAKFDKFKKIPKIEQYEYIVYAHSFTDGQLWLGNDGFENSYDWLDFTLKNLISRNKKVLIKCHPNYFNKVFGTTAIWDNQIFKNLYLKYKNNKNLYFIKRPVLNSEIMKKINKKCIAVTHHGNVVFELAHLNFKIIGSKSTIFSEDHKITNDWANPKEYLDLLYRPYEELKHADKEDLYNLVNNLFYNPKGFYGKNTINFVTERLLSKKLKKLLMTRSRFNNDVFQKNLDNYLPNSIQNKICRIVGKNILS